MQFKALLPLSAHFKFKNSRYKEQAPYLKNGVLNWFSSVLDELNQLSLTETNGYKEMSDVKVKINAETITTEESLKFDEKLAEWSREFASSLSSREKLNDRSVWLLLGFFSQYLLAKMKLYEEISQQKEISEIYLGNYRKELVDIIGREVFVTGWLDQGWVRNINRMRIPYDSRILNRFVMDSREVLGLEKEFENPELKLKLKHLVKNIPFVGR